MGNGTGMLSLKEVANFLKSHESFVVTAHVAPDPDAIGSAFGLAHVLNGLGKEVQVCFVEEIPRVLKGLLGGVEPVEKPSKTDVPLVVVDTASKRRVNGFETGWVDGFTTVLNIDHHISNEGWGTLNYVVGDAAASASLIVEIAEALGATLSVEAANLLYAGLSDDTGSFRFSNTTEQALSTAAKLVSAGANPQRVSNELYFNAPFNVIQLRGLALSRIEQWCSGKIGFLAIRAEDLQALQAGAADTEGLVDEVRSLSGTMGAAFMREMDSGWKISLRSKIDGWNVSDVAQQFGGGGHHAAAGCRIDGTEEQVREKLRAAIASSLPA